MSIGRFRFFGRLLFASFFPLSKQILKLLVAVSKLSNLLGTEPGLKVTSGRVWKAPCICWWSWTSAASSTACSCLSCCCACTMVGPGKASDTICPGLIGFHSSRMVFLNINYILFRIGSGHGKLLRILCQTGAVNLNIPWCQTSIVDQGRWGIHFCQLWDHIQTAKFGCLNGSRPQSTRSSCPHVE